MLELILVLIFIPVEKNKTPRLKMTHNRIYFLNIRLNLTKVIFTILTKNILRKTHRNTTKTCLWTIKITMDHIYCVI